jgi:hypothetical protein
MRRDQLYIIASTVHLARSALQYVRPSWVRFSLLGFIEKIDRRHHRDTIFLHQLLTLDIAGNYRTT